MRRTSMSLAAAVVLTAGLAFGQFGQLGREFDRFFSSRYANDPPPTEFIFARWQYGGGRGGWDHDYPAAEQHLNQVMSEATGVNVDRMSYKVVPISSEEIFDYPFGYISEPGQMRLSDLEVRNFREYTDRGGTVMLDDFDGARHFQVMRENLKRVYPEQELQILTDVHPLLNTYYAIDSLYVESPYAVGGPAVFYGITDTWGNLSVIVCYNNDVGDFWEHIDEPRYALRPSAEALRLGINIVVYAMTH